MVVKNVQMPLEGSDIFISNYQQRAQLCINLLCNTVTTWLFEMKSKQPVLIIEESSGASIFVFVT